MPLFYSEEKNNYQFAIWKMEEDLDDLLQQSSLSEADRERVNSFTHVARKKEWICIRLLLEKLKWNFSIRYLETGKPFLENSTAHISISHTRDFAGVIISESCPVGIDLERIHPRIEKIAHKFVSAEEEKMVHGTHHLEKLFVVWGVKEVLFKMNTIGELVFKEHLAVMPFQFENPGHVQAMITKAQFEKNYSLKYKLVEDLLITWCADLSRP